ncbi:DNA-directed RNA polymerase subunit E' [Candidatus Gugararchaeum adminiculabundum]|nr:DNA-directed RNA polymerase subunit E' [Candidatus Gugararchaeum adminiculabundum]
MYTLYTIRDVVSIPPKLFSMSLEESVLQILREHYERLVDKDLGIIISIRNPREISDGRVIPGDGATHHTVTFDALCYKPEVNEVFEGEAGEIVEFGAFISLGPLEGLVHLSQITNDFLSYDKNSQSFVGRESKKTLKKGDHVLAKISTVSLKNSIPESKIGLTMRPSGLGKPEWAPGAKKEEKEGDKKEKPKKEKAEKAEKKEKKEKK